MAEKGKINNKYLRAILYIGVIAAPLILIGYICFIIGAILESYGMAGTIGFLWVLSFFILTKVNPFNLMFREKK